MAGQSTDSGWTRKLLLGVGVVGGIALGRYAGLNLLIPAALSVAVFFTLKRFAPPHTESTRLPVAVQGGHLGWMLTAIALVPASAGPVVIDVVVLGALLAWLHLSPGRWPAGLLIAYQAVSLASNAYMATTLTPESDPFRALVVHMLWRAAALVLLVQFLRRPNKAEPVEEAFS